MSLILAQGVTHVACTTVNLRCPVCNHKGAFHGLPNIHDVQWQQEHPKTSSRQFRAGVRMCPNNECKAAVFVVTANGVLFRSFPPETIDFDSTNLPQKILETLKEAILCHSVECHRATALMVRRVLEELCEDRNATGKDLRSRLENLGQSVLVPQELLDAADELRLLGNDAAHVEAKDYDAIGKDEAALAIELAKELLKAVYQYASLVGKLRALKGTV